jgi:hypothetical protein
MRLPIAAATLLLLLAAIAAPAVAQPPGGYELLPTEDTDEETAPEHAPEYQVAAVREGRYSAAVTAGAAAGYQRRPAVGTAGAAGAAGRHARHADEYGDADSAVPWYYSIAASASYYALEDQRGSSTGDASPDAGRANTSFHEMEVVVEPGLTVRLDIAAIVVDRRSNAK